MKRIAVVPLIMLLVLLASLVQVQATNYPLEIIQPQEGLDTHNRYYKAYPGLEYKVDVAVIGGAWPFKYSLVKAPKGMTIDPDKGVITWPSPVAAGSPHTVSVKVVDSEGTVDTHTWTVTVTKKGFLFLDAVHGKTRAEGGAGTIGNPFKTITDWYCIKTTPDQYQAKYETTYPDDFVYYKTGVYTVPDWQDHGDLPMLFGKKPYVHLAFPGEKPVIDYGTARFNHGDGRATNLYWDGFEHRNMTNPSRHAFTVGDGDGAVFINNVFHGLTYSRGSLNQSCVMFIACPMRKYMVFLDNEFYDLDHGYCVLSYHTEKCLFERNTAHDIHPTHEAHHCIGLKVSSPRWFIRNNRFYNLKGNTDAIWLYFSDHYRIEVPCEQVEASWNLVLNSGGGSALILGHDGQHYGAVWIFRNTFIGSPVVTQVNTPEDGPVQIYDNVIVNPTVRPDSPVQIRTRDGGTAKSLDIHDNLAGLPDDRIVDADGRLTGAYAKYVGKTGCQLGAPTGH